MAKRILGYKSIGEFVRTSIIEQKSREEIIHELVSAGFSKAKAIYLYSLYKHRLLKTLRENTYKFESRSIQ